MTVYGADGMWPANRYARIALAVDHPKDGANVVLSECI